MSAAAGFGGAYTVLFDEAPGGEPFLPEPIRAVYGGDWRPGAPAGRPHTMINFVTSRDGRVSFNEPGRAGGGDVSGFSAADAWLMGLLRACSDTIMMGDGTLHAEPSHLWTCDFIFPAERAAFLALREQLGLSPLPLHVFLSIDGRLPREAAVFQQAGLEVLIATTEPGKGEAERRLLGCPARVEVIALGDMSVDIPALMGLLWRERGSRTLLCEGGPRVYGAMLRAGAIDEEFLTLSPIAIGEAPGRPRPSLIEGTSFMPDEAPRAELASLRRVGDLLFMRSRWRYPAGRAVEAQR